MKVLAINGSARSGGNTARLVEEVFKVLEKEGMDCSLIELAGRRLHGCRACRLCWQRRDSRCGLDDDDFNGIFSEMISADGILLASPTYFADVSSEMKALIDRAGYTARANGNLLRRKAGAGIVAVRRGGAIHAFDTLNHFFLIMEMIIPGSDYWNMGLGREPGDVNADQEGMKTMTVLGEHLAWLLGKLHS